jgi:hypothetical protein
MPPTPSASQVGSARFSAHTHKRDTRLDALQKARCYTIVADRVSRRNANRRGWAQLMVSVRPTDTLIVTELSRLSRSLMHVLAIVQTCDQHGLVLLAWRYNIETSTATARGFLAMIGAIAQRERERTAERSAAGRAAATARGHTGGQPRTDPTRSPRPGCFLSTRTRQPLTVLRGRNWTADGGQVCGPDAQTRRFQGIPNATANERWTARRGLTGASGTHTPGVACGAQS